MEKNAIEIIEFSDEFSGYIRTLNYEWLEKYFRIEEGDVVSLSNPKEQIIDKGGFIFFARMDSQIVGTASLIKKSEAVYELGKMAVTHVAQGHGIGKLLLEHCLGMAREKSISTIMLYSNTTLASAIHLYRKYGFTEVEMEKGLYERANIKMIKKL